MIGRIDPDVPQIGDLRDVDQIDRFRRQVAILRELGVKEYTDTAGRKIVLFERVPPGAMPERDNGDAP